MERVRARLAAAGLVLAGWLVAACSLLYPVDAGFFADAGASSDALGPTDGGPPSKDGASPCATRLATTDVPISIALDATSVWLTTQGTSTNPILRVPRAGGNPVQIAADVGAAGVAVDETHVYWATATGTVRRAPVGGGAPQALFDTGFTPPYDVTVDGTYVYVSRRNPSASGSVARAPKGGGAPVWLPDVPGSAEVHIAAGSGQSIYLAQTVHGMSLGDFGAKPAPSVCALGKVDGGVGAVRGAVVLDDGAYLGSDLYGPDSFTLVKFGLAGCSAQASGAGAPFASPSIGLASAGQFLFVQTRAAVLVYDASDLTAALTTCAFPSGSTFGGTTAVRTVAADVASRKVYAAGPDGVFVISF